MRDPTSPPPWTIRSFRRISPAVVGVELVDDRLRIVWCGVPYRDSDDGRLTAALDAMMAARAARLAPVRIYRG